MIRIGCDALPIHGDRPFLLTHCFQLMRHAAQCTGSVWIDLQRLFIGANRIVIAPDLAKDARANQVGLGHLGRQLQYLFGALQRIVKSIQFSEYIREIDPEAGIVWSDRCGVAQEHFSIVIVLILNRYLGQQSGDFNMVRIALQYASENVLGLLAIAAFAELLCLVYLLCKCRAPAAGRLVVLMPVSLLGHSDELLGFLDLGHEVWACRVQAQRLLICLDGSTCVTLCKKDIAENIVGSSKIGV